MARLHLTERARQLVKLKNWMIEKQYNFIYVQWENYDQRRVVIYRGNRTVWAYVRQLSGSFSLHAAPDDYRNLTPADLDRLFNNQPDD